MIQDQSYHATSDENGRRQKKEKKMSYSKLDTVYFQEPAAGQKW